MRATAFAGGVLVSAVLMLGCGGDETTAPVPLVTVTDVSPASGPLLGGTSVTITGTNFVDVTGVTIGGCELLDQTVVSATRITGITPVGTNVGAADIVVTCRNHEPGTCSGCFTYNPLITVTAVSPASGPLLGGTSVTITGTNFIDITSVTIGGNELGDLTVVSTTEITGTTPTATHLGAVRVLVNSTSYGRGSCAGCFTYALPINVSQESIAAGGAHTCALGGSGTAYCWGNNEFGQLGDGSTTPSATILASLWLWSGIVFFIVVFRDLSPALFGFTLPGFAYASGTLFVIQGILFLYFGVIRASIAYGFEGDAYAIAGSAAIAYAMILYPLIGYITGHPLPGYPVFGSAPCPVAIYTVGMLLLTNRRMPPFIPIIPLIWGLMGIVAVMVFTVWADVGLFVSGVLAFAILRRNAKLPVRILARAS